MKHSLITILLVQFVVSGIFSQESRKYNYQITLGPTISIPSNKDINISSNLQTEYSPSVGYFLDFLISSNMNQKFEICTGLSINYSALKIDDTNGIINTNYKLTNAYLKIPFLLKHSLSQKVTFAAGPYLGILINAHSKGTLYINTTSVVLPEPDPLFESDISESINKNVNSDFKFLDYGILLQLDYKIELNENLMSSIFTRFNYGINNVLKDERKYVVPMKKMNLINLEIGIGIHL